MKLPLGLIVRELNEYFVQPRLSLIKRRVVLTAITASIVLLCGLFAVLALFGLVFSLLMDQFGPAGASGIILASTIVIALLALLALKIARDGQERGYRRRMERLPDPKAVMKTVEQLRLGSRAGEFVSRNKFRGLAALALFGGVIGARPKLVSRLVFGPRPEPEPAPRTKGRYRRR